jgi:hypothetical protein
MKQIEVKSTIDADGKVIFRLVVINPQNESLTVEIGTFDEVAILCTISALVQAVLDAK